MGRKKKNSKVKVVKLDSLKEINLNAAGIDIGDDEIYVCVPEGRGEESVRCFETFTVDLHSMANWLKECGVETIAMESTGVYWIPSYEILEAEGFEVNLINARHIKNVPAKKSDVLDSQWIQQLHTYGLLKGSFRPSEDMVALRALIRHRENIIRHRSVHIQYMHKALQQMNLKLNNVVADITGLSGMTIIEAIIAGNQDPQELAKYRHPSCKCSEAEIAKALEGNYRPEHLFTLKQAVDFYHFYTQQLQICDEEIEAKYSVFKPQLDIEENPLPPPRQRRSKPKGNEPHFDLRSFLYQMTGVDLTQIDGIQVLTAQVIISEIGLDMSKWETVKHFTSWLGLCPNNQITGGKVKKRGRLKNQNRAAQALRMAAQGLNRSQSALGAFYRRMRAKHGPQKANVAAAHKLARIIYFMLKNKTPYRDVGAEAYQQKQKTIRLQSLQRQAKRLGYQLHPISFDLVVS